MIAILSKNILYYFLKEWIWQKFDKRDKKEIEAKQQSSKTKWLNNYKKKKNPTKMQSPTADFPN